MMGTGGLSDALRRALGLLPGDGASGAAGGVAGAAPGSSPGSSPGTSAGIAADFWARPIPVTLRYQGRSDAQRTGSSASFRFAPNLSREAVFFDASLKDPLPFREAMAALHDVVVSDARFRPRGRDAHALWKQQQADIEAELRRQARARVKAPTGVPPLDADGKQAFASARRRYWKLRGELDAMLRVEDPQLWRRLMPCDPVVTVAPDAVLWEGFSKDETSWGCVVASREGFVGGHDARLGTTNVDYSQHLADKLDGLRSYRSTRFVIDPAGLSVATDGALLHEEKIDLPSSWLKGFAQLGATLFLPARTLQLDVGTVTTLLAFLRGHREKTGPRSLRFVLQPGQPPRVEVLPFGVTLCSTGPAYAGPHEEVVQVWGRRRLLALARLLPLAQLHRGVVHVRLLGTGLPSVWSVDLGPVRFVLGLSGWTRSEWSGQARLDLLAGAKPPPGHVVQAVADALQRERALTLPNLTAQARASLEEVRAAVVHLARLGQVLPDADPEHSANGDGGVVRFRSILDVALSADLIGEDPPEVVAGRQLFSGGEVKVVTDALADPERPTGPRLVQGSVRGTAVEGLLSPDGVLGRARCSCSHFRKFGLRQGPCRHLLALRLALPAASPSSAASPGGAS